MARRNVNFTQHYSPVTCINPLGPVLTTTGHWRIPFITRPPSTKIGITYTVLKIYQRKQYFLWYTVCMKMLRKLSEKLGAKFPFTTCTLGYSMVRSSCLDDAFSSIFELETIPVEGWQLQQKDKKRRKRVGKKNLQKPWRSLLSFKIWIWTLAVKLWCLSKNVMKCKWCYCKIRHAFMLKTSYLFE